MCQSNVRKDHSELAFDLPLVASNFRRSPICTRKRVIIPLSSLTSSSIFHLSFSSSLLSLALSLTLFFFLLSPPTHPRAPPLPLPFLATSIFSTSGPIIDESMCVYTQTSIYYHVRASFVRFLLRGTASRRELPTDCTK